MANIKHTKNELKAQKEARARFKRFLPMLQLKKQQLQAEIQAVDMKIEKTEISLSQLTKEIDSWVELLSDINPNILPLEDHFTVGHVEMEEGNIAGVNIPILLKIPMTVETPDLFATPPWYDAALRIIQAIIRRRMEVKILNEQRALIAQEHRVTSQRVNLFEKVKIPECEEHIRIIKIFLGDEQTAGVVRGKFAKSRSEAL